MNIDDARSNMIKQQLRTADVLDERILGLMTNTLREDFVPSKHRKLAFADMHVPLGYDQVMFTPTEEGQILQALAIQPTEKVLIVGTGSGYLTALVAQLAAKVISVEIIPELHALAQTKLEQYPNVTLRVGNGAQGWSQDAPYDVIILCGALTKFEDAFKAQLNPAGRIFAILGEEPVMEAVILSQHAKDQWTQQGLFETLLPPLLHAKTEQDFQF